jgi:hypothetical protein
MSDSKQEHDYAQASASADKLVTEEYELASRIAVMLSHYKKSTARRAINIVAASFNQRLVPNGIPIGHGNVASVVPKDSVNRPKGPSKTAKAAWKKDQAWVAATQRRSEVVHRLKSADDSAKAELVEELRDCEAQLGQLKTKLRQA